MTPLDLAKAFLDKGREDESLLEAGLTDSRIAGAVFGFHAQQAAEKYLKAVLAVDQERPEKTHDLKVLANQCELGGHPVPEELAEVFDFVPFAVDERYPFAVVPPIDRTAALNLVIKVREWARQILARGSE